MAQVQRTEFVDDFDGKPIDIDELNQVHFAVEGIEYRLELRDANYRRFIEDMDKWTSRGVKVGKMLRSKAAPKRDPSRVAKLVLMREWAREQGYEVSDRGRLAAEIEEAYEAANN